MKIVELKPVLMPGNLEGTLGVMLFGLGDDGLPYRWNGKNEQWELAK